MEYTRINENIHRMTIPYKDIFTTVYTVESEEGAILFDAATFESDITDILSCDRACAMMAGFKSKRATEELCRRCGYARRFKL